MTPLEQGSRGHLSFGTGPDDLVERRSCGWEILSPLVRSRWSQPAARPGHSVRAALTVDPTDRSGPGLPCGGPSTHIERACHAGAHDRPPPSEPDSARDIAEVPALEIVSTAALHLMSAAAVNLGLAEDLPEHRDLDEARTLIEALAGLVVAAAPRMGHHHAAPLRDGLRSLQLAFREASDVPDAPGEGPGEKLTGPVSPTRSGR